MIQQLLGAATSAALASQGIEIAPEDVHLERPSRVEHGDWATNVALVVAKRAGRVPRELAEALASQLAGSELSGAASTASGSSTGAELQIAAAEAAGPGFVNIKLAPSWLHQVLRQVVEQGESNYAQLDLGQGSSVSVEFVSANPTGPLHAGGGRWGAYGDTLVRLFDRCGYQTTAEYYVNDRGSQMSLFARSLLARRRGEEPPEDGYQGEYVAQWAAEMPNEIAESADLERIAEWGRDRSLEDVFSALKKMDVRFDHWQSENELVTSGAMEAATAQLENDGHIYKKDGAKWLRTTDHGDTEDRVLVRRGGEPTYFMPDIAYHHQKLSRSDHVIDVLGADHHGYVARMRAAMAHLGHDPNAYEAVVGQNVVLMRGGKEVELSKRTGTMVEVSELIDAVGPDVARLAFLLQSIDSRQTIDIDLLRKSANENPVFYVQYAHARIASIGREAVRRDLALPALESTGQPEQNQIAAAVAKADLAVLTEERELAVLRCLEELPFTVELALRDRAPHKISNWVRELANAFHGFYHDCPILRSDVPEAQRVARLWLTEAARIGLAIGLDLLGVTAPEEM